MTRRPRVLLSVHDADRGGAELMALAEARHLEAAYDLTISVPDGPLRDEFAQHGAIVDGTAKLPLWGAPAKRWVSRAVRTVAGTRRLVREIRERGIDVVLTNSSVSMAPVLAARIARVPVIVHVRDVPASRLAGLVFALHGALADTVIVIADDLDRRFARSRRARVVKLYEGIVVPPDPPAAPERSTADELRLLLVGGIDPRKGQDLAIEAVAGLAAQGVDARLELAGRETGSGFTEQLREQAARLGVTERVTFLGQLPSVGDAMRRAHVVIAPSRSEWTPLSLMEAMAARRPVVAASVGGVAEVVPDGEAGLLVGAEDVPALTAALAALAADPARAAGMGRRGREVVEQRFDIERSLRELEAEIERTMDPRAQKPLGAPDVLPA